MKLLERVAIGVGAYLIFKNIVGTKVVAASTIKKSVSLPSAPYITDTGYDPQIWLESPDGMSSMSVNLAFVDYYKSLGWIIIGQPGQEIYPGVIA